MFLSLFLFISSVQAEDVVSLPEIVVEGKRLRGDHRSAVVLTETELAREAGRPISEVLREAAGVDATIGTGGNSSVSLRGASGSQTLVIIDGVKANDPSLSNRFFDWTRIDATQIERVEILKGPQAVSYGSDAIGGVILIRTKRGASGFAGSAELGSDEFYRLHTSLGIPLSEKHNLSFQALGKALYDGDSSALGRTPNQMLEGDNSREGSIGGEFSSRWSESFRSKFSADLRASNEDIDAAAYDDDPNSVARNREIRSALHLDGRIAGVGDWSLLGSYLDFRRAYSDYPDATHSYGSDTIYRGKNSRAELQLHSLEEQSFEWVVGTEATGEKLEIDSILSPVNLEKDHADSFAGFAEGNLPLLGPSERPLLASDFGARYAHFTSYGNQWSGKWGLSSKPSPAFETDFGLSTGFKAPSLFSLYAPLSGNPGLKPEESVQIELGGAYAPSSSLRFSLRGFKSRIRNRFGFGPPPNYQSTNIENAEIDGVEFENEVRIWRPLAIRPNLTYLHSVDKRTGLPLSDVPRWKGGAKFEWDANENSSLIVSVLGKSERTGSSGHVAGFGRVDATLRRKYGDSWTGIGRFENLLDHGYQEIGGYSTPGISAYFGVEYRD